MPNERTRADMFSNFPVLTSSKRQWLQVKYSEWPRCHGLIFQDSSAADGNNEERRVLLAWNLVASLEAQELSPCVAGSSRFFVGVYVSFETVYEKVESWLMFLS